MVVLVDDIELARHNLIRVLSWVVILSTPVSRNRKIMVGGARNSQQLFALLRPQTTSALNGCKRRQILAIGLLELTSS